jgi:hypothetical protein
VIADGSSETVMGRKAGGCAAIAGRSVESGGSNIEVKITINRELRTA